MQKSILPLLHNPHLQREIYFCQNFIFFKEIGKNVDAFFWQIGKALAFAKKNKKRADKQPATKILN